MIVCTMFDKQFEFNEQVDHEPQGLDKRWEKRFFTLVQQTVVQGRVNGMSGGPQMRPFKTYSRFETFLGPSTLLKVSMLNRTVNERSP